MKLLLDTHAFIWWDSDPGRLSPQALALIHEADNVVLVSVASVWEMQVKQQLGKLTLRLSLARILETQQQTNKIHVLPVELSHVLALDDLPSYHKDPFDRLLVAQAKVEGASLVSADPVLRNYPIAVIW